MFRMTLSGRGRKGIKLNQSCVSTLSNRLQSTDGRSRYLPSSVFEIEYGCDIALLKKKNLVE